MAFQSGLSGLNAASRNLDVIGHNIANANTVGMKSSRAEFGELVASSLGASGNGSYGAGLGVSVASVSQQFTQGNISITGNNMDVAINGNGFFQLQRTDGSPAYTRDGQFKLDSSGNLVTNTGANVMGFPTDASGVVSSSQTQKLSVPSGGIIQAVPTDKVTAEFNLDARALGPTANTAAGNAAVPRSTYGTSLNVYDSQGVPTPVSLYFEKTDTADTWDVFTGLEGSPLPTSTYTSIGQIAFDSNGNITGPAATTGTGISLDLATGTIATSNPNSATGTLSQVITVALDGVSQFGSTFSVSNLTQNGYASGNLTGLTIGSDGILTTRYSNGQSQATGKIAMANFANVQGLNDAGSGNWLATNASGIAVPGAAGEGSFGLLTAGALEESNVDLTGELVNMMTAQRAYQANAQTIKTQDAAMQTLINLR